MEDEFTKQMNQCVNQQSAKMVAAEKWNDLCNEIRENGELSENSIFAKLIDWFIDHSKRSLYKGEEFYRARLISASEVKRSETLSDYKLGLTGNYGFCAWCSGAPPAEKATVGRVNRENVPVLYLSSSPEGACVEVHPRLWGFISVASFVLREDITVIDLSIEKLISNQSQIMELLQDISFNSVSQVTTDVARWEFINSIGEAFRVPGNDHDLKKKIYPITQSISSYIRQKKLDGLVYSGVNESNSHSLAIFDPNKASCESKYGEIYHYTSSISTFHNITKMEYTGNTLLPRSVTAKAEYTPWDFSKVILFRDHG